MLKESKINKEPIIMIYMDHNATTPLDSEALAAMLPYLKEHFGNPSSSTHEFGRIARMAVEEARAQVAQLIGAQSEEMIFTSGATEADNLAIKGISWSYKEKGNHIITCQIEHKAVLNSCKSLEQEGYKVTYLPVDKYGLVDPDDVKKAIGNKTILITIMYANSEIGTLEPIADIGKIAQEKGVIFHTDAVQAAGKIPLNVEELHVDLLSMSGHKMYGPKGIGALYLKNGTKLTPLIHGGGHERGLRSGTENVPGIVGFGKACEIAQKKLPDEMPRLRKLRERLVQGVMKNIKHIQLNGHPEKRIPGNANFSFHFIEGEALILSLRNFAISSGSACTSGSLSSSYVLRAIGVPDHIAHGSIRICLGRSNTTEQVDLFIKQLKESVSKLRELSPLYEG
jgi:cysteine desulfurase